jgi:hypothetical protein
MAKHTDLPNLLNTVALVGASLLAKAFRQLNQHLTEMTLSRAGSLPQLISQILKGCL